ncbi:hypothetical protein LY76DRAFT_101486 [Colletotrichum caudatum]|nr:hypothetical protein LY76DRAFT_101486 [Colletotrichum caudatum]
MVPGKTKRDSGSGPAMSLTRHCLSSQCLVSFGRLVREARVAHSGCVGRACGVCLVCALTLLGCLPDPSEN